MRNLLLAGGDRRMIFLGKLLEGDGWHVETIGLQEGDCEKANIGNADAVLFGYPFSVKDGWLPALTGDRIKPEEILGKLRHGITLLAGKGLEGYAEQDIYVLKRYKDAAMFEEQNAALSAEAAVCECMLHSSLALMDAKVMITGYGLFGRAIALRLKALGAEVWVAARREKQRQQAADDGMKTVSIVEMPDWLSKMDVIVNTIPARILGEYHLKQIRTDCRLLEMASAPYGFDMDTAKAMGVSCALLPGLPARYSPQSAAIVLYSAVREVLGRCAQ